MASEHKRQQDKRERILAAATAVFAGRDFHRVQMSEVASRAGVGKGTVYLYFPTKDRLHRIALEESLDRVGEEMERAAAGDAPPEQALRDIVISILRFFWRRQDLLTMALRYERRNLRRQRALRAVERVLARHRLGGTGAGRHLAAAFLLGMARAAILEHAPEDRPETVASLIVALYLGGIRGSARAAVTRVRRGAA